MITNDPKGENKKDNFKRPTWPHNLLQRKESLSQQFQTLSETLTVRGPAPNLTITTRSPHSTTESHHHFAGKTILRDMALSFWL